MSILQKLQETWPDRGSLYTALFFLEDKEDILQFYDEYARDLAETSLNPVQKRPYVAAAENIAYALSACSPGTFQRWTAALYPLPGFYLFAHPACRKHAYNVNKQLADVCEIVEAYEKYKKVLEQVPEKVWR